MSNPRQLHVIGKKSEVADRTLNERKFCAIDDYYYSEMFTCPICFGADRERERIIKLLKQNQCKSPNCPCLNCQITRKLKALIKGEQK